MSISVKTELGGRELSIETGKLAAQAGGAVTVRYGDTIVLVTATARKEPTPGADFFPLTVMYQEKTFAAGKIPGGFFKREGRPSEQETLTGRLTDRPIRPLFPKEFTNETQVIATVLSSDIENEPDIISIIGASAALLISPIPFMGPVASVRIGRINGQLKVNPKPLEMVDSDIDLVVAAKKDAVVMVEGGANMVSEEDIINAIEFAHKSMLPVFEIQEELAKKIGAEKWNVAEKETNEDIVKKVRGSVFDKISKALKIPVKKDRYEAMDMIVKGALEDFTTEENIDELAVDIKDTIDEVKKEIARKMILEQGVRIDGRNNKQVRNITSEAGLLPRVHGSALFTRGETQVLSTATLGTSDDQQLIDNIGGEYYKRFMLHYNFPPFSVGEVKRLGSPSRREIGHGALAERALTRVLPDNMDFPYTVRVVSEVLSSNGSSSMATVCSGSMALMDAGVKIKNQVAGIAMGLIKEGDKYVILSDILGDEDHLGDMDFKVAGTKDGITALQMDIKIAGISGDILKEALQQAKEGRLHILGEMSKCISEPRADISRFAPRIIYMKIEKERIRDLIGSGGNTINKIISETGVKINVDDEGNVEIAGNDAGNVEKAIKMAKSVTSTPETGKYYKGKVVKIAEFGAFVRIMPNTDGLVHISELEKVRTKNVTDVVNEGEEIIVKVLEIDPRTGKIRLSKKDADGYNGPLEDVFFF